MNIKNVSGIENYFAAGKRGVRLANNATATVEDTPEAMKDVLAAVYNGLLEIVETPNTAALMGVTDRPVGVLITVANDVAEGAYSIIEGVTFEYVNTAGASVEAGAVEVVTDDDDAAAASAALKAAINANATLADLKIRAINVINTSAVEIYRTDGDLATAITVDVTNSTDTETAIAGIDNTAKSFVVVSQAGAATAFTVHTGLKSIDFFTFYSTVTATGATAPYDGTATPEGGSIDFDNGGSSDIVGTDLVYVLAYGTRV